MDQQTALKLLKSGENVFITGSAGTGKTHLLNNYVQYLKERKVIPSIVAPTGIAASHLNGQTIHSFFSLGIRDFIDDDYIGSLLQKKYLVARFAKLKILIVDEVSMIAPEIFSFMDKILRAFKETQKPFGGVQVILSGDFFQLPPVNKNNHGKRFAWQSPSWKDLALKTCYLQEKFRQDDNRLIQILDEIRSGKISSSSHDILETRYQKELNIDFVPTKLYTHNIDVDRINQDELNKLPSPPKIFTFDGKGSQKNIEKVFKTSLVLETLTLKKDAIVLFIKNNHELGYVNGTTGVVIGFDEENKQPIVKLTSGRTLTVPYEDWSLENDKGSVVATVSQIPLRLAWAITIHKSQGMTLDAAEIDLSKTFETGQGYVALSRIRNIEGLRLMGVNEMALKVDPLILSIDHRILGASQKAKEAIEQVSEVSLEALFSSHITALGGTLEATEIEREKKKLASEKVLGKASPEATHITTKNLIANVETIEELATKRALTVGTIMKHLALLKADDATLDLSKFKPDEAFMQNIQTQIEGIKNRGNEEDFMENGGVRLKPIFVALQEKVSYDEIKLALFYHEQLS